MIGNKTKEFNSIFMLVRCPHPLTREIGEPPSTRPKIAASIEMIIHDKYTNINALPTQIRNIVTHNLLCAK